MSVNFKNDDDRLAGEYALGVLEGPERDVAQQRYRDDAQFRQRVDDWQKDLTPLLANIRAQSPRPQVWQHIEQHINPAPALQKTGIWQSLAFWRGLAALGMATAGVLIAVVMTDLASRSRPDGQSALVASLTATGKAPAFLAAYQPGSGAVMIKVAHRETAADRVAELWIIPGDGKPRSLGLLAKNGNAVLQVSAQNQKFFTKGGTLAVSLEPAGGSPTGAPTGPVIASGKIEPL